MILHSKPIGTQPPEWVSESLISILDTDKNGVIEVQELWDYLGAIGFHVPVIEEPMTEKMSMRNLLLENLNQGIMNMMCLRMPNGLKIPKLTSRRDRSDT